MGNDKQSEPSPTPIYDELVEKLGQPLPDEK